MAGDESGKLEFKFKSNKVLKFKEIAVGSSVEFRNVFISFDQQTRKFTLKVDKFGIVD